MALLNQKQLKSMWLFKSKPTVKLPEPKTSLWRVPEEHITELLQLYDTMMTQTDSGTHLVAHTMSKLAEYKFWKFVDTITPAGYGGYRIEVIWRNHRPFLKYTEVLA